MTTVEVQELSAHLRTATEGLAPRPEFAAAVVRGGRRRQNRRRLGVVTAAVAVVAIAGGSTYAVVANDTVTTAEIMAGWLDEPTKGDLAGDQRFLDEAIAAWQAGQSRSPNASAGVFDDLRGTPHVYWAGSTPAGPAAVVVQQTYLHPHEQLPPGAVDTLQTLVGLAATDPKDGKVKLVADEFRLKPTDPPPGAFQFGKDNEVLLVVDRQEPVWAGHSRTETIETEVNGTKNMEIKIHTDWQLLPMVDGVGITKARPDSSVATVVSGQDPELDSAPRLSVQYASNYLAAAKQGGTGPLLPTGFNQLGWTGTRTIGSAIGFNPDSFFRFGQAQQTGLLPEHEIVDDWFIEAGIDRGRAVVVSAIASAGEPWQVVALEVDANGPLAVLTSTPSNRNVPLPVLVELPRGQGWIVATKDAPLSYRADGDWVETGDSAAVVPADTTQVKVGDTVVDLPH
jgi:hypothetical protein